MSHQKSHGDFTILVSHIVLGCKFVASAVNKAGLAKLIGLSGDTNVQPSNKPPITSSPFMCADSDRRSMRLCSS
jgi:fructose-1,6-bisphosphatase